MAAVLPAPVSSMDPSSSPPPPSPATSSSPTTARAGAVESSGLSGRHATSAYPAVPASHTAADERALLAPGGLNSVHFNRRQQPDSFQPDSQESLASSQSVSSHAVGPTPRLQTSSSNVSTSTVLNSDTTSTSPVSANGAIVLQKTAQEAQRLQPPRPHTPSVLNGTASGESSSASTSPMSIDTPYLNKGTKRTASGAVKSTLESAKPGELNTSPLIGGYPASVGRKPGISELSSQLKTRLSYAMLKVQHGWERQNIEQLEAITPVHSAPATPISQTASRRRLSIHSEKSDRYFPSPTMDTSPHRLPHLLQDLSHATHSSWMDAPTPTTQPRPGGLSLAPAAPISTPRPGRRSMSSRLPPLLSSTQPTTQVRAGILRMPSQQAEKDAVDTLLFMSSPNNSANLKYATSGSSATSPLRNEFPAPIKRVAFDSSGNR